MAVGGNPSTAAVPGDIFPVFVLLQGPFYPLPKSEIKMQKGEKFSRRFFPAGTSTLASRCVRAQGQGCRLQVGLRGGTWKVGDPTGEANTLAGLAQPVSYSQSDVARSAVGVAAPGRAQFTRRVATNQVLGRVIEGRRVTRSSNIQNRQDAENLSRPVKQ